MTNIIGEPITVEDILGETKEYLRKRVYVAGKWEDREAIKNLQNEIIKKGYEITVDWTKHEINDKGYPKEYAEDDIQGVRDCDIYVGRFVMPFTYKGALVEMGVALAFKKQIIIIGHAIDSCIFKHHYLVEQYDTDEDFLKSI